MIRVIACSAMPPDFSPTCGRRRRRDGSTSSCRNTGLNSSEGVALLSLAEAFLRVPDPETADLLIADKIGDADWRAHRGKSNSTLVNSATWGLVIGRVLVGEGEAGPLRRLISRAGEPFVRQAVGAAMRMMGEIFVMGRTIDEAMKRMRRPENAGFTASFDMLGRGGADAGGRRALLPGL